MPLLQELIVSGRIVDLMLAVVVIEIAAVAAYRRATGGGVAMLPLLTNVGAGGSLMLALRLSLADADWKWIAVLLVVALLFHVADLWQRWSRPTPAGA